MKNSKFILIIIFLVFGTLEIEAQIRVSSEKLVRIMSTITGTVLDSITRKPVVGAVITDIHPQMDYGKEMLGITNFMTDKKGKINYTLPKAYGARRVEIAYPGYKLYKKEAFSEEVINLGKILLVPDPDKLDEGLVKSRLRMQQISGDSTIVIPRGQGTESIENALKELQQNKKSKVDINEE